MSPGARFFHTGVNTVRAAILLLGALSATAMATPANVAAVDEARFISESAAAIAAANQYNPTSIAQDREFMGAIYQCQDGFRFSVAAGEVGAGNVTVTLRRPTDCVTTALWHTHGAAHHHHKYFSDIDTRLVQRTGLPFYMADYTGSLRLYSPGDRTLSVTKARRLGLGGSNQYAEGKLVRDNVGDKVQIATRISAPANVALATIE